LTPRSGATYLAGVPRTMRDGFTRSAPWMMRALLATAVCVSTALPVSARAQSAPVAPDPAQVSTLLAQKYDSGAVRALAPAQACYRAALDALASGRTDEALRLLDSASDFDPLYPDPHFTLARVLLFRAPGRALSELTEGFRILGRSYAWQRHLLANALTALLTVWFLSLLLAMVGIVFRHLPHLLHILGELTGRRAGGAARSGALLLAAAPALWLLGLVPTAATYTGLLSFRLGRREGALVLLFFVTALAIAGGLPLLAPWAGAPTLDDPSLLVNRAMKSSYDPDLAAGLQTCETADPTEPLYPFALGALARRGGDLALAEQQLTQATLLRPDAWALINLGNVAFAQENYARARDLYERAAKIRPGAVEPHYNLAQVYTKQLLFAEASREQSVASALAFDRVRDMSRISAPQLNRTVMDASPSAEALWNLARQEAPRRANIALSGNPWLVFLYRLGPRGPFALAFLPALFLTFAGLGQVLARKLQTLHCSNCQKVVCRRCVHRMQQRAFCHDCFESVKNLKSVEFTRLLLSRRDRKAARVRTIGEAIVTFVLPGAGQMLRGASVTGFMAILVMVAAGTLVVSSGALVPSPDVIPYGTGEWTKRIPLLLLFGVTYALTVMRYFAATTAQAPSLRGGRGSARRRESSAPARARGGRG
jgi:tetratricopeptide (TPR) repeat protein